MFSILTKKNIVCTLFCHFLNICNNFLLLLFHFCSFSIQFSHSLQFKYNEIKLKMFKFQNYRFILKKICKSISFNFRFWCHMITGKTWLKNAVLIFHTECFLILIYKNSFDYCYFYLIQSSLIFPKHFIRRHTPAKQPF